MNIGIVGARRGRTFRSGIESAGARVSAVCDINENGLSEACEYWGEVTGFTEYERMLQTAKSRWGDVERSPISRPGWFCT